MNQCFQKIILNKVRSIQLNKKSLIQHSNILIILEYFIDFYNIINYYASFYLFFDGITTVNILYTGQSIILRIKPNLKAKINLKMYVIMFLIKIKYKYKINIK